MFLDDEKKALMEEIVDLASEIGDNCVTVVCVDRFYRKCSLICICILGGRVAASFMEFRIFTLQTK